MRGDEDSQSVGTSQAPPHIHPPSYSMRIVPLPTIT